MSIWKHLDNALDWIQIAIFALMAGVAFGIAFGWFIGACVVFGFLTVCVLVARGMKSVIHKSLQTSIPQRSFPEKKVLAHDRGRHPSGLWALRRNLHTPDLTARAHESEAMISTQYVSRVALLRDKVPSFDRYPFCLPALRAFDRIDLHPKVTFFVGENGSGKSTLLEAIAVSLGFNAEGGSKNFRFETRRSHSELHEYLRLSKGIKRPRDGYFLRAESFFNVATEIENLDAEPSFGPPAIDSYGGHSLHEQSHGESFMALLTERFGGQGLYILDEPEAALSPQRQLAVLSRMHDLVLDDSQFIVATHSPILMAYPDAHIYQCSADGVSRIDYQDTEHFRVTRDFLASPERMLRILLER